VVLIDTVCCLAADEHLIGKAKPAAANNLIICSPLHTWGRMEL
jgi:hypothetical protein